MRMVLVAAAAAVFFAAATAPVTAGDGEWTPTMAQVQQMEARVHLPDGASPLDTYFRFYAGVTDNGRREVEAVYLVPDVVEDLGTDRSHKVQIVAASKIPYIMDGGCRMVTVFFDAASGDVVDEHCNGQA